MPLLKWKKSADRQRLKYFKVLWALELKRTNVAIRRNTPFRRLRVVIKSFQWRAQKEYKNGGFSIRIWFWKRIFITHPVSQAKNMLLQHVNLNPHKRHRSSAFVIMNLCSGPFGKVHQTLHTGRTSCFSKRTWEKQTAERPHLWYITKTYWGSSMR